MIKRQRLSAERSRQLTRLLTIANTANIRALMEPSELAKVIALVAIDIGKGGEMAQAFPALWPKVVPQQEYYDIAVDWFTAPDVSVTSFDVVDMLDTGASLDQDFMTYLTCLTELHKRRRKVWADSSTAAPANHGAGFSPSAHGIWAGFSPGSACFMAHLAQIFLRS